ncbi:pantothenate synthetase [Halopolyspora algeriensis]|uniref:Pantothenate synthetase n=1 Tax=Halopolyspora algeriensis TaxID=1500506 RepID=A0A368VMB6_9ACTN|nr:pantoate--beta-alanine ligase [Halopolyspora algeriensis]RCW40170.1 pantothenate synthetase [Halopolyspora algeriensis]TQM46348.1 pantothenate synthetase [Halopolyspora algeriensis]
MTSATPDNVGAGPGYTPGSLTVHRFPAELAKVTRALRGTGRTITLVPTMGALHEGHRELIRRARRVPGSVTVVSIFVNPLQFGPGEDFERYPRPFDADVEMCREEGVELVLAPEREDVYGSDPQITVHPGEPADQLEGASRPGHFAGVLTIVAKLFNIVRPDLALFGEKDYQQLALVRRMSRELNFDVAVQGIPLIREPDGLALSSRNAYLTAEQREAALSLSAALTAGAHVATGGAGASAVLSAAREVLDSEPLVRVDYLELRDPEFGPAPAEGEARLLIAATVGETRLIDNALVLLGGSGDGSPPEDPAGPEAS